MMLLALPVLSGCNCDETFNLVEPELRVKPATLDFGKTPVGSLKKLPLILENTGARLLEIKSIKVDPPFRVATSTLSIFTGTTAKILVDYLPTEIGDHSSIILFETNQTDAAPVEVPVKGSGIQAAVTVNPLTIDFGEVLWKANTMPETRDITVSNTGSDNFDLTSVTWIQDGDGALSADSAAAVTTYAPGDSQTIKVTFAPNKMGSISGQLSIKTTAPTAPEIVVSVMGKAVGPVFEVCTQAMGSMELCTQNGQDPLLDYGLVEINTSATGTIRLLNTGDRPLTVGPQLLSQETEFSFTPAIDTMPSFTIPPAGEQRIDSSYNPQDYAFDSILVAFGSDAAQRPSATVRVDGKVPKATINIIPRKLTFSLQGNSNMASAPVKIINCGNLPLVISATPTLRQTGGPGRAFGMNGPPMAGTQVQPGPCTNDAPGSQFIVTFSPSTAGTYRAEISVASNDPQNPTMLVEIEAAKR